MPDAARHDHDEPSKRGPARRRLARAGLFVGVAAAGLVALAWLDVLPGGWRLRTLFVPQSVQDQHRRAAHRADRLGGFEREALPSPGATLFIGSSTIERFPLQRHFPELHPVNRGIGDEDLAGLEARALSTVRRLKPATVVVYAASINVRRAINDGTWTPPEEIVRRIAALAVSLLAEPGVSAVVLIGVLPEQTTASALQGRLTATNTGLATFAETTAGISFLPTNRLPLVDAAGNLGPEIAADALHLNAAGYDVLAEWLGALLPAR